MFITTRAGGPGGREDDDGPGADGRGTILVPATMVAPGLLARCDPGRVIH
jgi:hypothetical protein